MKNILFIAVAFLTLTFIGCEENSFSDASEIKLVSEKGFVLASSLEELVKYIEPNAKMQFGDFNRIKVTNIEFIETELQSAAIVDYEIDNGQKESLIFLRQRLTSFFRDDTTYKIDCTGGCGCRERVTVEPNGTLHYECTCDDCAMTVEVIE